MAQPDVVLKTKVEAQLRLERAAAQDLGRQLGKPALIGQRGAGASAGLLMTAFRMASPRYSRRSLDSLWPCLMLWLRRTCA